MLFNSVEFIVFLSVVFLLYHHVESTTLRQFILVAASLLFYGWWRIEYLPLLVGSICANFFISRWIFSQNEAGHGTGFLLTAGVVFNLLLLGTFKYTDFIVVNLNGAGATDWPLPGIVLPLAISFFTFQQIAYLADASSGKARRSSFLDYALFVTFFPQLIAGPIVHHSEMMPQFAQRLRKSKLATSLMIGSVVFIAGLAKKILFADNLAPYADAVFRAADAGEPVTFFVAWSGALAYTLQLYFDFSGYSDMAIGIAFMFGVRLPLNFFSPYKAASIIEFWKRWHITLSRFLRDYLYFPLGGSRVRVVRKYGNILITMGLGGLWHGAGWTFVLWGLLHGFYLVVNHTWRSLDLPIRRPEHRAYRAACVILTFLAVTISWVLFRATSLSGAIEMLTGMAGLNGVPLPAKVLAMVSPFVSLLDDLGIHLSHGNPGLTVPEIILLAGGIAIVWGMPNVHEIMGRYAPGLDSGRAMALRHAQGTRRPARLVQWRPTPMWAATQALVLTIAILFGLSLESPYLYFQF